MTTSPTPIADVGPFPTGEYRSRMAAKSILGNDAIAIAGSFMGIGIRFFVPDSSVLA